MKNEQNTPEKNLPRDFKGIWVPREIWLHHELSWFEKSLWAEIDSLDREEEGCTASNQYLCNFFNVKERTLQDCLSRLKKLGFIRQQSFDGRRRTLRSSLKTTYEKFSTPPLRKTAPPPCGKPHPSPIGASIERENKEENKENLLPKVSSKPDTLPKGLEEEEFQKKPTFHKKQEATELIPQPNEEEEAELLKRWNQRGASAPRIDSKARKKAWRNKVLLDIRSSKFEAKEKESVLQERIDRHKRQALKRDGDMILGFRVKAWDDRVEFSSKKGGSSISYALSDQQWAEETGWREG